MNYDDNKLVFKKEDGQKIYFEKVGTTYVTQNNDTHVLTKNSTQYIITGKDRTYYFTLDGQITSLVFNTSKEINYVYNANNQLTNVVLQNGDELEITYGTTGLIISLSYVSVVNTKRTIAQQVTYAYDADDRLIQVTDPLGFTMTYSYDDLGRIISWTDFDNNNVDQIVYDSNNRVTSVENAFGIVNSFTYYTNKGYTEWRQDDELISKVTYNSAFKTEKIVYANGSEERKTYRSDNGQLNVETLMNGATLTYTYDDNQNITTITRSDGHYKIYTYDSNNNMLSESDYIGNFTTHEYQNNQLVKTTFADGTYESFSYENGVLKTHTDQCLNVTTYTNDDKGRHIQIDYANGENKKLQYNLMGYIARETDTNGNKRVISRNYRNEIVYETTFEGDITQTTYNGNGDVLSITDGNHNTHNYTYNQLKELIQEFDPYGNYLQKNYDNYGNLISENKYDVNGNLVLEGATSTYDQYNRLINVTNVDGSYEKYQYNIDGELERKITSTTNSEEIVTLYRYDQYTNNIIQEHLDDNNVITRDYDANGNLLEEISADGAQTIYTYDNMNRLLSTTTNAGLVTTYDYDANGNNINVTNHENEDTTYYTNWSDWTLASESGISSTSSIAEKTQYRVKTYEEKWVKAFSYLDYTFLGQERELNTEEKSWRHTDGLFFQWVEGYVGTTVNEAGYTVNVYGYKDYTLLDYCLDKSCGTDANGRYCRKFYTYYIEYKFGGYPTNFSDWQDEEIIENENNIVETRTVYSVDGQPYTTQVNPSIEDTDLIDKELILKRKFYDSDGFSDWSATAVTAAANKVIEERYLYRSKAVNSIWSSNTSEPGYVKTFIKEQEPQVSGYMHTNTLGFIWKEGLLGETTLDGKYINLYGYKDYQYEIWGYCTIFGSDSGGTYCKKTRYSYVNYKYDSSGEFSEYQEDSIPDTSTNIVETQKQYRYDIRDYSDYQLLADEAHPYESDITKDEVYLRTRSKMIVPDDIVLSVNDTFNVMSGVSATDASNNNITSTIAVNITSIDTSIPGSYELVYTLGTTGLEVSRLVDVVDNNSTTESSTWITVAPSEVELTQSSGIVLLDTQELTKYLISNDAWTVGLEQNPGTTPITGDLRIIGTDPYYKQRSKTDVVLSTTTPPDSTYQYVGYDHTSYSDWTITTINWDACSIDNTPSTYGGLAGLVTKYRSSDISGYWTTVNHNTYYYSYYVHTRCGYSAIYKYPKSYPDTHAAYKVDEYSRTYTEMYKFFHYGTWSNWIAGTMDSDNSYERINQDLYKYIDGTSSGYIETLATVPSNYYPVDTKMVYTYQIKNTLSVDKYLVTKKDSTIDLKDHYQYTNPVNGDLSSAVTISISLNGHDLTNQLNNGNFTFDNVGLYEVVYTVEGLTQTQKINVRASSNDRSTTLTYNSVNQIITTEDTKGNVTNFSYTNNQLVTTTDALGNITRNEYNRNNQLTKSTIEDINGVIKSAISYTYDGVGNKLTETDINGYQTQYVYDANNNLKQNKTPTFDDDNQLVYAITQYDYDAAGRLVKETNPYGLITRTTYDNMGRVSTTTTQIQNGTANTENSYEYDINSQVTSATTTGITTEYTYNKYGDLILEEQANGLNIFRTYDSNHRLITETSSNKTNITLLDDTDRTVKYSYDYVGRTVSKTDVLGRKAIFKYDAYGNVITSKDYDGLFTQNYYDTNNLIELTVDARNNTSYFYYNQLNQLVEQIDVLGNKTTYTYDALGNQASVTNALNETTTLSYDMYGNVVSTIDALDQLTTMSYTPNNKIATINYYDLADTLIKQISYHYDLLGNQISVITSYTNPLTQAQEIITTESSYNEYGQLVQSLDANNNATTYEYNEAHQLTTTTYPNDLVSENVYNTSTGVLIETNLIDPTPLIGSTRSTHYMTNVFGEVIKETKPNGSFTSTTYTLDGQIATSALANDDLLDTADDYITTYSYDDNGKLIQVVDNAAYDLATDTYADQILSTKTYNNYGDLSSMTDQNGLVTNYEYDSYGRQITTTLNDINVESYNNGTLTANIQDLVTTIAYDQLSRPITITEPSGLVTSYEYDALGNIISKVATSNTTSHSEAYTYDRLNNMNSLTNALNEVTTYQYDALGNLIATTGVNQETTINTYDDNANVIKTETFNSDQTKSTKQEYVYDSMNQLTQTKEYRTIDSTLQALLTTNTYDMFGDLIAVQDPTGYTVTYDYDNMGNKIKTSYSDINDVTYTYNTNSQLLETIYSSRSTDLYNQFTTHETNTYYRDGKLKTYCDNPPASESEENKTINYYYTDGLLSQQKTILSSIENGSETISDQDIITNTYDNLGMIITMKDDQGQTNYHYDINGNISQTVRIKQNVTYLNFEETMRTEVSRDTVGYTYDAFNKQTSIIYPDNTNVNYTYDGLCRVLSVTDTNGITTYSYDDVNNHIVERLPSGESTSKTYELGQTTHLVTTSFDINLNELVVLFEQTLVYDESGNVISEIRVQDGTTTNIANTYDERGQLTESEQVTGINKVLYQYILDPFGNKSELTKYYVNDVLSSTDAKNYTYDHLNRLESSTLNGVDIDYDYDAYGNLISEDDGTTEVTYVYDLNNNLSTYNDGTSDYSFEYDGNGNRLTKTIDTDVVKYVNDLTKTNETVLSYTLDNTTTNYTYGATLLYENNNSYRYDSFGNVVSHASEGYSYTPYGTLTSGVIDTVNEYGYKGEVHDTASLQYLRARYYNTALSQFISEDTYTGNDNNPLSQNRYTFVSNNPYKYSDPSGNFIASIAGDKKYITNVTSSKNSSKTTTKTNTSSSGTTSPITTTTTKENNNSSNSNNSTSMDSGGKISSGLINNSDFLSKNSNPLKTAITAESTKNIEDSKPSSDYIAVNNDIFTNESIFYNTKKTKSETINNSEVYNDVFFDDNIGKNGNYQNTSKTKSNLYDVLMDFIKNIGEGNEEIYSNETTYEFYNTTIDTLIQKNHVNFDSSIEHELDPEISDVSIINYSANYSMLYIENNININNENIINMNVGISNAETEAGVYLDTRNLGISAEAMVSVAKVNVEVDLNCINLPITMGIDAYYGGLGYEFKIGYIDNKLVFKVGGSGVIGGSIYLTMDPVEKSWEEIIEQHIKDTPENAEAWQRTLEAYNRTLENYVDSKK